MGRYHYTVGSSKNQDGIDVQELKCLGPDMRVAECVAQDRRSDECMTWIGEGLLGTCSDHGDDWFRGLTSYVYLIIAGMAFVNLMGVFIYATAQQRILNETQRQLVP